ncbi:MAG: hypothetical protein Q4G49_11245, partial [Paracoccus sp. (in: a-proteobacteria)]|nr:hypothetical protein [Paracoccus sp. (in: a-proteobacteria)]
MASRPVRSAGCPYVRILPPVTSALILIWAGPAALAATLYYDFGDTQSNGLFNPQSGGEWDNSTANWWSATTKAPVQFQSGHNVIFRHDNDGAVDLTLTQPVTPGNISVERGDFTIDATATGNLSSVGGWWRDLTVADGASLTYQGSFSGSYNVSVAGNLILSADSATLGLVEIADTGQAVLSSIAGGGITSIARLHNRGDLTIAQGADVSVIHAPARNFADATMQIDGHLSATLANDSGATMDLGSNGTITGSLGNNGLLRLAGGTINGTLNNGGLIQPVIGGAALTVVGDFINGPTGVIAGSADDPLAITADNITLRSGSLIEGQVQLNGAVLNQSVLNLAALDGLHGSLTNAGTVTVDSMVAGNGRALTNTSSFTIGATGNLSALGLLTNTGNLTLDADGRLGAQQIRHDGGSLTSAGLLHADDIRLAATASLSGEIAGRLDVAGGVTTVHGDLTVAATSGPPVTVSGGQLRLANDAHLTADTVMNAGQLYLSSGAVLTGAVTSSGHIGGTGLIDGDLRLTGAATFDVLNNTGTLINAMAAPQTLSGFGPLTAVHVENRGVLSIDQDMAQGLTNATAGDLTILRNVAGHVTSWGKALILPQTGQSGVSLTGGLTVNGGKVVTRGAVGIETTGVSARIGSGAALTVADGALTVSDRLVSNGNLMVQDGAALNAGRINLNGGGAAISGQVTGETVVGAGATLTLDGAWLDGPLSNTGTIGTASATGRGTQLGYVSNSGTAVLGMAGVGVQIDGAVVNSGDLTVTGVVAGTLDNTGTATLTGSFAQVKNSSKAMLTDAHVSGPLSNAAGGNLTVSDGSVAGVLDNAGTATLSGSFAQIDNSGTAVLTDADVTGPIGNTAGGNLTVSGGSVSGVLTNAGNADLTGSFAQIGNSGTATLTDADVSGTVTNAAGGDLSVAQVTTGGLVNHGSLTLTGEVGGAVTNAAGGQTTMTPAALVTGDLMNHGGAILSAAGVIGGDLVNAGAVQMTGDLSVGGDLTNTGNLTQTTGNTTLTIAGQLNQNGNIDNGGFGQITIQAGSVHLGGKSNVGAGVDILGDIIVDGTVDFNQDMVLHDTLIVAASGTMTVAGALDGQGTVAVGNRGKTTVVDGGALTGLSGLNNRGDLTIASGGSVEAGLMTGHAGSSALNAGTLAADVVLNKGATLTSTGVVQGKTSNAGTLLIRGRLTDDLTNAVGGTVTVNGALDARGADLTNNGTVQVKSGVLRADHLLNRGGLMLVAGASAVLGTGAQNIGTISAQGRVVGNLANSGTASLDRQLEGAASNTGTGTMTLAGG